MTKIVPRNIHNCSGTFRSEHPQPAMMTSLLSINHLVFGTARANLSFPLFSPHFTQFLMAPILNKWYHKFRSIIAAPPLIGRISAIRFSKWPSSVKDMHISIVKLPRTACWWRARKSRASSSKCLFFELYHPLIRSFQHCGVFCILNVGVSGLI